MCIYTVQVLFDFCIYVYCFWEHNKNTNKIKEQDREKRTQHIREKLKITTVMIKSNIKLFFFNIKRNVWIFSRHRIKHTSLYLPHKILVSPAVMCSHNHKSHKIPFFTLAKLWKLVVQSLFLTKQLFFGCCFFSYLFAKDKRLVAPKIATSGWSSSQHKWQWMDFPICVNFTAWPKRMC